MRRGQVMRVASGPVAARVALRSRAALSFSLAFGGANAVLALGLDPD